MQAPGIPVIALALLLCVLVSGCTSDVTGGLLATPTPLPTAPPTTIPTTVPVVVTIATPVPTTIEPVQTLPAERQINLVLTKDRPTSEILVLTKDRPTSEIHLLFQGGPGEIFVTRVMMRVYTSDTVYQEYIMSHGSKPIPGDEIVAPGTRSGDRCEVFVISAGARVKVMDTRVYGGMYY